MVAQASGPFTTASVSILGVRVDDVTYAEAVAVLHQLIQAGRCELVTTPNPEFVLLARRDPEFRAVLDRSALAIPDGFGLLVAAMLLGQPLREHVRGTDLVYRLAERCRTDGHRWFLLGAAEGIAAAAAEHLARLYPGLQVAGSHSGSPRPEQDAQTQARLKVAGQIDVLLVAYGAPLQEEWIARNQAALGIPVAMGVGGVFNYFAGASPRAPRWMRRLELEWLHRLVTEPWRWRRQVALPRFLLAAAAEALRLRLRRQKDYAEGSRPKS